MDNKNLFSQWDKAFGGDDIQKRIDDAAKGNGDFKEVDHGKYEVSVQKLELTATKEKKNPMVSVWFKIVSDCEFKGSLIFMNQVITEPFQIHIVNEFLRDLLKECASAPVVEFKTYAQYADLLMDVHELIADNFEYALDYGKNKKGFDTYKITEVYALED